MAAEPIARTFCSVISSVSLLTCVCSLHSDTNANTQTVSVEKQKKRKGRSDICQLGNGDKREGRRMVVRMQLQY